MAVIVPTGRIKLCNVPFDNSYEHQLTFPDITTQQTYFGSKIVHSLVEAGYTYIQKENYVRVPLNADLLYNANYLMYQNTSFADKWFYAFITKIEWLSDASAAVYFETDVWQTWYFQLSLKDSFVAREHSPNLLPLDLMDENVELGEYKSSYKLDAGLSSLAIIVATTVTNINESGEKTLATGNTYGGIYSGCEMIAYDPTSSAAITNLNNYLKKLTENGAEDSIVSIYMCPKSMLTNPPSGEAPHPVTSAAAKKITITPPALDDSRFDGFLTKNTKMSTYPYQFYYIHNNAGSGAVYRKEFFTGAPTFEISGTILPNPTFKISPVNYKNRSTSYTNHDESITLSGFPLCQWTYDAFKAWYAQNGASTAIATIGSLGALGAGIATANPTIAAGGIMGIASQIARVNQAAQQPPQARGNAMSGGANAAMGIMDFTITNKSITGQYAQSIDNYFTMFGYTCNKVKTPNIKTRQSFNYIQTKGLNATGLIPVTDMRRIKKMFDDGVTFWHKLGVSIYNYTQDNLPV